MNCIPKQILLPILAVAMVFTVGMVQANSAENYQNRTYGYEVEPQSDWTADLTGAPDIAIWAIGEGGRFIVEVIPFTGEEWEEPVPEDVAADTKATLGANFEEFYLLDEGWTTNRDGLQAVDINFECLIDEESSLGTVRITFGHVNIVGVYYDDRRDFDYHLPDIKTAFDSLRLDETLIDESLAAELPVEGEGIEYIDPIKSTYRNETFAYSCENPGRLVPEEVGGPGWIVLPTGDGEVSIRFLDAYQGGTKGPDVYLKEMLDEILVSFNRYDITREEPVELGDGRTAYLLEVDAVYNGADWMGAFVGFVSDNREPFLVKLLAPVEEYDTHLNDYETLWTSFVFEKNL